MQATKESSVKYTTDKLAFISKEALDQFDSDKNGALCFTEFMHLLGHEPWSFVLSEASRSQMPELAVRAVTFENQNNVKNGTDALDPVARLCGIAKNIFAEFDEDDAGTLTEQQLKRLIQKACGGRPEPEQLSLLLARILGTGAQAQGHAAVASMDLNIDGVVQQSEYLAAGGTAEQFDRYDRNKDGVLDASEMALRDQNLDNSSIKFDLLDFLRALGYYPYSSLLPEDLRAKMPGLAAHGVRFSRELQNRRLNAKVLQFIEIAHKLFSECFSENATEKTSLGRSEISKFLQKVDSAVGGGELVLGSDGSYEAVDRSADKKSLENRSVQVLARFDRGWNGLIGFSEFIFMLGHKPFLVVLPYEIQRRMPQIATLAMETVKMKGVRADVGQVDAYIQISNRLFEEYCPAGHTELKWLELTEIVKDSMAEEGRDFQMEYVVETVNMMMARFDADDSGTIGYVEMMAVLAEPRMAKLLPATLGEKMPSLALLCIAAHEMQYIELGAKSSVKSFFDAVWTLFDETDSESTGSISAKQLNALMNEGSHVAPSSTFEKMKQSHAAPVDIIDFAYALAKPEFDSNITLLARAIDIDKLHDALKVAEEFRAATLEPETPEPVAVPAPPEPPPPARRVSRPDNEHTGKLDEEALFERAMGRTRPLPADSPLWIEKKKKDAETMEAGFSLDMTPKKRWMEMPEWHRVTLIGRIGVQLRLCTVCTGLQRAAQSEGLPKINRAAFCVVPRDFGSITAALENTKSHGVVSHQLRWSLVLQWLSCFDLYL